MLCRQSLVNLAREQRNLAEAESIGKVDGFLAELELATLAQQDSSVLTAEIAHQHPIGAEHNDFGMDAAYRIVRNRNVTGRRAPDGEAS